MTQEPSAAEGIIGRWLALGGKSPGEDVDNLVKILEDEIRAAVLAERDRLNRLCDYSSPCIESDKVCHHLSWAECIRVAILARTAQEEP